MRRLHTLALLAALLAAAPLGAQTVRGTLREASGAPVNRVLVALVDGSGRQVARTLTDAEGGFTVRAPAAGRYSLRAERVGYAAVTSPAFELGDGETRTERLVATGAAVMLQGLTVSPAARRCVVRPGAGLATATLWEEARKALNAAAFSQSARLFRYDLNQWTREIDPSSGTVRREDRQTASGLAELPFRSLPPGELSAKGYVHAAAGDSTGYWGPDAAVMLSPEFLNDHCLRVVDATDAAEVGLAFEPVRGRRVPDISGTLWLDRRTAELRRVEYRYQGGPRESDNPRVGGTVEYERMAGGPWIVRRWSIRMPQVTLEQSLRARRSVRELGTGLPGSMTESTVVLAAVVETGGEVTRVSAGDGRALFAAAAAPVVRGTVWDSTRAAPLAGARVYLSGTQAAAETGPDGAFTLRAPGTGRYTVAFSHPELGPLASAARNETVTLGAGDTATVALAVRGWASARAALCPDSAGSGRGDLARGIVTGRVTGPGAAASTVTGSWWAVGGSSRNFAAARSSVATRPDPQGFYVLCGVSTQALVTVRAQAGAAHGQADARPTPSTPARADVELRELSAAERMAIVAERPAPRASARVVTTTFRVTARDSNGGPLAGAVVRIGSKPAVTMDGEGRARAAILPPGEYAVEMAHPATGRLTGRVTVPAGLGDVEVRPAGGAGSTSLAVVANRVVALAGVEARSSARSRGLELQGFYERRQRGGGVFLTDSALQSRRAGRLSDVLRRVPGIRLMRYSEEGQQRSLDVDEGYRIASGRATTSISRADWCWMDVYLDGQLVQTSDRPGEARNLDQVALRDLEAVEIYRGAAEVPTEYRGSTSSCGVLLLWTRRHDASATR
ncbi:MAG TPA: carboxypeptidase regulatory-like domain-containing protein [Longimicrobium sp.]|nr:carboxypeptidase regulatory-like domain-containing protein [Longimicrobium sp.]